MCVDPTSIWLRIDANDVILIFHFLLPSVLAWASLTTFSPCSKRCQKDIILTSCMSIKSQSDMITVPERQRNTHLLQRNTNKKITEHSLFSSTYSYISSSINCFSNSWCILRGMWIKNIFIHLYHQSKSIYGDQGLRNNSLKLRYDFLCFCAKKRNTRQWVFR